jgi:DNA-directed RNA polymerase specialized sigma24 family protein
VLRHLADLPETEIVRVTGLSLGTVKTHLRRALHALRDQLAERTAQEAAGA